MCCQRAGHLPIPCFDVMVQRVEEGQLLGHGIARNAQMVSPPPGWCSWHAASIISSLSLPHPAGRTPVLLLPNSCKAERLGRQQPSSTRAGWRWGCGRWGDVTEAAAAGSEKPAAQGRGRCCRSSLPLLGTSTTATGCRLLQAHGQHPRRARAHGKQAGVEEQRTAANGGTAYRRRTTPSGDACLQTPTMPCGQGVEEEALRTRTKPPCQAVGEPRSSLVLRSRLLLLAADR